MTLELKVGILVVAAVAIIAGMSLRVQDNPLLGKPSQVYYGTVPNATGLIRRSSVKMAGLNVGYVEGIELQNGNAKIAFRVDKEVQLYRDASITIKAMGILGDKYIEITPGLSSAGILADGETLTNLQPENGVDQLMAQTSKMMNELQLVLTEVKKAIEGQGDQNSAIGRIVRNIETITEKLADIGSENKDSISQIIANVKDITSNINQELSGQKNIDKIGLLGRLNNSMSNIEKITQRVERGEGSVGRLLKDDETIDRINSTISGIQKFIGKANRVETQVDVNSQYMMDRSDSRSSFGLKILPSRERSYNIAAISTPEGDISERVEKITENGNTTTKSYETTDKNKLKLTAQFGKRMYNFDFRLGLTESTGGVGVDYYMLNDNWKISADGFGFDKAGPNLRISTDIKFLKYFYGTVGGDDLLKERRRDLLVGGGLRFNDEDLKSFISLLSLGK